MDTSCEARLSINNETKDKQTKSKDTVLQKQAENDGLTPINVTHNGKLLIASESSELSQSDANLETIFNNDMNKTIVNVEQLNNSNKNFEGRSEPVSELSGDKIHQRIVIGENGNSMTRADLKQTGKILMTSFFFRLQVLMPIG